MVVVSMVDVSGSRDGGGRDLHGSVIKFRGGGDGHVVAIGCLIDAAGGSSQMKRKGKKRIHTYRNFTITLCKCRQLRCAVHMTCN